MSLISIAHAAGVIDDAPTLATAFFRVLDFLLSIFGFVVIIALVFSGILYFTASGSTARLDMAKKSFSWAILGCFHCSSSCFNDLYLEVGQYCA